MNIQSLLYRKKLYAKEKRIDGRTILVFLRAPFYSFFFQQLSKFIEKLVLPDPLTALKFTLKRSYR